MGRNLLNNTGTSRTVSGVTFTVDQWKRITISGTATADIEYVIQSNSSGIATLENTAYFASLDDISEVDTDVYFTIDVMRTVGGVEEYENYTTQGGYQYYELSSGWTVTNVAMHITSGTTVNERRDCILGYNIISGGEVIYSPYWSMTQQACKTNWTANDRFNVSDYARIRNNIIRAWYNLMDLVGTNTVDSKYVDVGSAVTSQAGFPDPAYFNAFENNLATITQYMALRTDQWFIPKTFVKNGLFITYDELNRLEGTLSNYCY